MIHNAKKPANTRWFALAIAGLLWCAASPPTATAAADTAGNPPALADTLDLLELWIEEQRSYRDLPGISIGIVHGDRLVWARGFGHADLEAGTPATPDTLYRIGSVTKLFTSTAILQLRDRGLLRLDDPVKTHLPWFQVESDFEGEPEVTVRHLITHTAGLPREGAFPYWTTHEFPTRAELIERLPTQKLVYPPGSQYKYSNLGMALLGEVVAAASGQTYDDYLATHVFAPLGMGSTRVRPTDEDHQRMATAYFRHEPGSPRRVFEYYDLGAIAPAGNIVSSVTDLARFAALQFRDGPKAEGEQILRASSLREMHRPQWLRGDWQRAIGLGFRLARRDGKIEVSHGGWVGGNRTHLLLVPEDELAVIVLTNADDASPSFFSRRVLDTAGAALLAAQNAQPADGASSEPPPELWQRFVGSYTDPWAWETQVVVLGNDLVLYDHGYPPSDRPTDGVTRLEPTDEPHTFRLPDGESLRFQLGDDGRVQRIWKRSEYLEPKER